jgi:hypothetical protein
MMTKRIRADWRTEEVEIFKGVYLDLIESGFLRSLPGFD